MSRWQRNVLVFTSLVFAVCCLLPACSHPNQGIQSQLRIASLLSLTGSAASLGEQIRIGQEIARDYWKQEKIAVDLQIVDNKASPYESVSAYRMLRAQGYEIFVSNMSNVCMKLKELIEPDQTLIAMASIPGITHPPKTGVYMYSQTAEEEVEALLNWLDESGYSSASLIVIHSEDDYGIGFANYLEKNANSRGLSVSKVPYTKENSAEMRTVIGSRLPATAQYIPVVVGIGAPLVQGIASLRELGYDGPILASIGYSLSRVSDSLGDGRGHVVYTVLSTEPSVEEQFLKEEYIRRTGRDVIPAEAIAGFNSVYMLVKASQETGSREPATINQAIVATGRRLSTGSYQGGDNEIIFGVEIRED